MTLDMIIDLIYSVRREMGDRTPMTCAFIKAARCTFYPDARWKSVKPQPWMGGQDYVFVSTHEYAAYLRSINRHR